MPGFLQALPYGLSLIDSLFQQRALNEANRLNQQRYQEGLGIIERQQTATMPAINNLVFGLQQGYNDQREMLRGLGEQAGRDIDTRFTNLQGRVGQDLVSRGLSGTSVLPSMRLGVERERSAEHRRLAESLRREQYNAEGNRLAQMQQLGLLPISAAQGFADQRLAWMSGQTNNPPNQQLFAARQAGLGYSSYPAPSPPESNIWEALGIGVGSSVVNTVAGPFAAAGFQKAFYKCIDAEAEVRTKSDETAKLRDLHEGDYVVDGQGIMRRILERDCGKPWPEREGDYVLIVCEGGHRITLTNDHVIGGKPAGEWEPDQIMPMAHADRRIIGVYPTDPLASGDLKLDGGATYIANGFIIQSGYVMHGDRIMDSARSA